MLGGSTYGRSTDPTLCLCEYYDYKGERNHILACCCDCEAVDTACDRLLTCRRIEPEIYDKMWQTIIDRIRIPNFTGKGAIQVHPDVAIPGVLVPVAIFLATINQYFTVFMLTALPLTVFLHYRLWSGRKVKERTRVFYMWGLVSVFLMMAIFLFVVTGFRKILLWEIMVQVSLFGVLMYYWVQVRKDPGIIRRISTRYHQYHSEKKAMHHQQDEIVEMEEEKKEEGVDGVSSFLVNNFGFDKEEMQDQIEESRDLDRQKSEAGVLHKTQVKWVDSRGFTESGYLSTWCETCQVKKMARSGHCPVCAACILGRDHHCVWIDNCVGAQNHKAFFWGLVFLLLNGYYGAHLTLTTVCTPTMYWDWFLFPADCDFVYSDLPTALSFVSACYTIIFVTFMFTVCIQQSVFISQNVTTQELHQASLRGWATFCCTSNNVNNHGLFSNWKEFLSGRRGRKHQYGTIDI